MDEHSNTITWIISTAASSVVITTVAGLIPPFAAFIALIWYFIQIYESDTFKRWNASRRVRKIARLKAHLLMLESKPAPLPPGFEEKL